MAQENFQDFYTDWIDEQKQHLDYLILASKTTDAPPSPPLSVLVSRTVAHYEKYYTTKSRCAKHHVLLLLSPPWISQLEDAFIWVGGWRPTTAFHLLYSKSGLQFDAKFSAIMAGNATGSPLDLADLSSEQLCKIDKLQRSTTAEERRITEKVAKQQESVADAEMVELSRSIIESSRAEHEMEEDGIEFESDHGIRVESALKLKEEGFEKILQCADDLRLATLKSVIDILSPVQAVHFLIAAAELHLRLHQWGREKEEREAYERTPCNAAAPAAANTSTAEHVTTN